MLRIGIDIGGTFTDLTVLEDDGRAHLWKEPTTPDDPLRAIVTGLEGMAGSLDRSVSDLLGEARLFVHGTTIATNTVIQRNGPRIGLLATGGFRDVLYFRDAWKPERFNVRFAPPEPFVDRFLRLGVTERINSAGEVVTELDEDQVREHARYLGRHGVEAVAVAFLWSIMNPDHEQRAAAILQEELPDAYVICSADVVPEIREWERTSAAVLSAYILPGIDGYFRRLKGEVTSSGLREDPLIMQLNGGCAPIDEVLKRPVYALHSGPAAAPAAAAYHAGRRGLADVITIDMGGTSFDVCLVRDGAPARSRSIRVDQQPVGVEGVAVHSVGAGGGSIAFVDEGGALNVGPRSAGSVPGPAAYGAGGTEPTVTDANVVLGYLDPKAFLGGRRELRADLAEEAVAKGVGEPLGLDPVAAAAGVIRVVNASMTAAVRAVSVERGLDPRNFALVVGGGAGGLHSCGIARDLGIRQVVIPREAGTLCAFGMTVTDVRHDYLEALHATSGSLDSTALDRLYGGLEEKGRSRLLEDGFEAEEIVVERSVDARYPGQVYAHRGDPDRRRLRTRRAGRDRDPLPRGARAPVRLPPRGPRGRVPALALGGDRPDRPRCRPGGARRGRRGGDADRTAHRLRPLRRDDRGADVQGRGPRPRCPRRRPGDPGRRHDHDPARRRRRAQLRRGGQLPDRRRSDRFDEGGLACGRRPGGERMSAAGAGASAPEIDNVTFSVMLRRLQSISREMAQALERSAVSSIIALCHDFSCVIYDAKGRQLSVHDPIPVHVTAMELQIEAIEETFGADVHDGDVFLANDPYRGNTHVGDIVVARPVFVEGLLVFWVMIKAHHIDVGAFEPSSCTTASRDVYQEGIQIPPVRIVAAGIPRHDVLELVYANVRLRDVVEGDLLAQIGAAERGHSLILEFCEEFGLEQAEAYADQVIAYASKRMATLFKAIPDGSYKGYGWVDSDGYAAQDIPVEVEVTVAGEHVTVDFEAGPQAEGGLNGSHATTLAAGRIPFLFLADPDIPHNQGCFDQIEVKIPRGTIAESLHPASTSCATMIPTGALHDAINKALAPAIPDLIPAGTARSSTTPQFFGVDEVKDEDWGMMIFNACGGGGATKQADGWPLMETTGAMGGQKCVSIEQMELLYPVRVEQMEVEPDSMGFGTKLGGFGVRFVLRPLNGPMECITFGDGVANPPHGVLGGRPAIGGGHFVEEAEGGLRRYISAAGRVRVPRGDTWTAVATGGGGYGSPHERDPERVRIEVRDGVIGRAAALEVFGVVVGDGEDPELDLEATAARRAELASIEIPVVIPEGPRAAAWVDDNLREGDVYLENPTVA